MDSSQRKRLAATLALLAAFATSSASPAGAAEAAPAIAPEPSPVPGAAQRFVHEGIGVDLSIEPLASPGTLIEGETVRVRLKVSDVHTGSPLTGLYPAGWMDLLPAGAAREAAKTEPDACRKRVQAFVGGSILDRPALDLNVYHVLALNQDATISVVDPLFGYGNSKLLAMVFLKSPGEDWALTADGGRLFVSMPDVDRVAVVESAHWNVAVDLETGPRPRRVALQPDGQYLWVAYEGKDPARPSGVTVVDARNLRVAADLPTGRGGHDLAFSDDSRFAFVTNEGDGTVSVVDVAKLAKVRDVATGSRPVSISWSRTAGAAYVAHAGGGGIVALRPGSAQPAARIAAEPGLGAIRFAPGGRLAFAVHPGKKQVYIVDAASNRLIQTADVEAEPDQVFFSDELAYIRHRGSETVLMVPLKVVGEEGRPVPLVDFPGGQNPPGKAPKPALADGIVQAAGAPAVLVANPLDKAIYFYKEGMAAPMGHFQNYGRQPRAVLVVDRSLRETSPGVYETLAELGDAGEYDLALLLDSPRLTHCFPVRVAENPALAKKHKPALGVEILAQSRNVAVGEEVPVRFRLSDSATGAAKPGLPDVRVLTFLSPGTWQQRHWANDLGNGVYEARFTPPEPGVYFVFLEVASAGMPFRKSPFLVLQAAGKEGTPAPAGVSP